MLSAMSSHPGASLVFVVHQPESLLGAPLNPRLKTVYQYLSLHASSLVGRSFTDGQCTNDVSSYFL